MTHPVNRFLDLEAWEREGNVDTDFPDVATFVGISSYPSQFSHVSFSLPYHHALSKSSSSSIQVHVFVIHKY
jgi:hypothetical protein